MSRASIISLLHWIFPLRKTRSEHEEFWPRRDARPFRLFCETKNEHGEEKNERENMWVWEGKKSSKEGNAFSEAKRTKCTPRER